MDKYSKSHSTIDIDFRIQVLKEIWTLKTTKQKILIKEQNVSKERQQKAFNTSFQPMNQLENICGMCLCILYGLIFS